MVDVAVGGPVRVQLGVLGRADLVDVEVGAGVGVRVPRPGPLAGVDPHRVALQVVHRGALIRAFANRH